MRDPKTHAKVIALRRRDVAEAAKEAEGRLDHRRTLKLQFLLTLLNRVAGLHHWETRWSYDPATRMWSHVVEIPDTEEELS